MSSRIKTDAKHAFDCFLEVAAPQAESEQPWILQCYPPSFKEKESERLHLVPQFTFPCRIPVSTVQHFSFVRTNLEAVWTFGFVRYAPDGETALCILSPLPWHELFFKLLNQCSELLQTQPDLLFTFLSAVHTARLPLPGLVFHVEWDNKIFTAATPSNFHLPSIPDNRNLTEYFNAVDSTNMLIIFVSMLYERRIVISSNKLSRLSACVQAANSLIYPMFWQHIFIPILPAQLMDYLSAPMPFLIGVPEPLMKRIKRAELGEVVILDADNNKVETPFNDLENLPVEVLTNLQKCLKPGTGLLGDSVARAFLQALVHLIGGYRDALRYRQGEKITFNEDAFIMSRSSSLQPFLEQMLQLQIFRQFIDERLELLNSGKGFSDEFELECVVFTDKSNKKFKNQYMNITHNVKKEGAAFAKAVKEKTNPAMKQAVRSVKDSSKVARNKAKSSYKDVKLKFKDKDENKDDSSSTQSAPSSPTSIRSSTLPNTTPLTRNNTDLSFGRVIKYERFDPSEDRSLKSDLSPDLEEVPRLEYNLMNDLEEIMVRNKKEQQISKQSNQGGEILPPEPRKGRKSEERKSSVVDLISLETESSKVVFDPLLESSQENKHKVLERSGNSYGPQANSTRSSYSQQANVTSSGYGQQNSMSGRGYGQQAIVSSQSYGQRPGIQSYGQQISMSGQSYGQHLPNQSYGQQSGIPNPQSSLPGQHFNSPIPINGQQSSTSKPSVHGQQSNWSTRDSDDLLSEYGLLDLSKTSLSNQSRHSNSDLFSNNNPSISSTQKLSNKSPIAHLVSNNSSSTPPSIPPRTGSSFLYGSAGWTPSAGPVQPAGLPVNSRLSTVGQTPRPLPNTSSNILADLDPLSHQTNDTSVQPPTIPPRTRKQWTTFD